MPKVSVCIPTYNTAKYVGQAIESVLQQDYQDYELIVCDNASTDETPGLVRRYDDPRLQYVRFDEFVGQAANWNRCVELARGKYVVLLHSDDMLRPAFLRRAAGMLDRHPQIGLLHCVVQHVSQDGSHLHLQKLYEADVIDAEEKLLRKLLLEGCVVNPAGVMVQRKVYEAVGKFTEQIVWGVDWHMWTRIALRYPVAYLSEPLALYRQHQQSGTTGVLATARNGSDEVWMMNDIFRLIPAKRADLQALYAQAIRQVAHRTWCFAEELCQRGFGPATRAGVKRAVSIRPAMLMESRVWALWVASWIGYEWFARLHRLKRDVSGRNALMSQGAGT
jgi:glycosyltransferase involved in cell wall biosynthesis